MAVEKRFPPWMPNEILNEFLPPLQQRQPAMRVQLRLGAVLQQFAKPTPLFEHEDSLSAVANALSCTPLKVGLASEARSTTGLRRRRKHEHEDDFDAPCEGGGPIVNVSWG